MSYFDPPKPAEARSPLANVLEALQAAGEITRLRLLTLVAEAELTVSELVTILGQSQPRVSRHLRLLVEAGMVERHREGAWAFFHIAQSGAAGQMARNIVQRIEASDPVIEADRARLEEVRRLRANRAASYFAAQAQDWNRIRSLHLPEEQVERTLQDIIGEQPIGALLDLGTGTGRMLQLLAPYAGRAMGVDLSTAMLNVARAGIDASGLRNVQLRQGDLYALPVEPNSYGLVILHQVLHYLDDPARALREASRALAPGGRLLVIDFAPHDLEFLREQHEHRRLGFSPEEIISMLRDCNLNVESQRELAAPGGDRSKLTVSFWIARDPRVNADFLPHGDVELA